MKLKRRFLKPITMHIIALFSVFMSGGEILADSFDASYAHPSLGVGNTIITSDVFLNNKQGSVAASEGIFTRQLSGWLSEDGEILQGEVVHVGRGCDADSYLANPAGKIALIERGACQFLEKIARAYNEGAIAVIVYNIDPGVPDVPVPGEVIVTMLGPDSCNDCPNLVPIPGFFIARSAGLALAAAASPVKVKIQAASFRVLKDS